MSPVDTLYVDKANWVVNLSSRSLSDAERALLKKGLNFAVTPANTPATEIIAMVEAAVENSTLNKQILSEELLTVSFNRRNNQSLTSRRRCEMHLKA